MLVAVTSLVFTYRQISLSEAHDRISVQPRITLSFQNDGKRDRKGWYMSNNGLGPAYFTNFQLYVDNLPIQSKFLVGWIEALQKLGLRDQCFSTAWTPARTSVASGNEVDEPLLRLDMSKDSTCDVEFAKLFFNLKRLKVKIDYQSIYGENFSVTESPDQLGI